MASNNTGGRQIPDWIIAGAAILALIISVISIFLSLSSNHIALRAQEINETNYRISRTPRLIIKDQVLDEKWDSDPLRTQYGDFDNEKMSIGVGKAKLSRQSGESFGAYVIVLNTANNSSPSLCEDNYSYIVLSSTGAKINSVEILGTTVTLLNGRILELSQNENQSIIKLTGEERLILYTSLRSDYNENKIVELEVLSEKYKEKYSNTDDGSTIDLKVEVGATMFEKIIFKLQIMNEYNEYYYQELSAEVIDRRFVYDIPAYPAMIDYSEGAALH